MGYSKVSLLAIPVALLVSSCAASPSTSLPENVEASTAAATGQVAQGTAPASLSSAPAAATFEVTQSLQGQSGKWTITADQLQVATASEPSGADTTISVTFSGHAAATLKSAKNNYSLDRALNATPYWNKDSAVCKHALTPGKGSLSALGIAVAKTPEQWVDYSKTPNCGLNWNGFDIKGPNQEMRLKETAQMTGSLTLKYVVPGSAAESVVQNFAAPDGWMFSYPDATGICGTTGFGHGRIVHSTTPVC